MDSSDTGRDVMNRIAHLYEHAGRKPYDGGRRESVTALEHALQCAQLAEWAGADGPLVAAALLHDVGDLVAPAASAADSDAADNQHELRAFDVLHGAFGPEVLDPIRLHVAAKRYLVATEPSYRESLSPASLLSLQLQGGPMSEGEQRRFEDEPFAPQAVLLRRWDDAAKTPGKATPSLDYYMALLDEVRERPRAVRRSVVGALDV
jgi:phosphonate degradation associated HDIG domain protein